MTKPTSGPQKGDKRRYIREAIESLGLDAKYVDAAKWVKDRYGIEVSDPTFYHLRKEMQQEARRGQPGGGPDQPSAAEGEPTPAGAASQTQTTPESPGPAGTAPAAALASARPTGPQDRSPGARPSRRRVPAKQRTGWPRWCSRPSPWWRGWARTRPSGSSRPSDGPVGVQPSARGWRGPAVANGLALKEARDAGDACPRVVKERLPRPEADKLRALLEQRRPRPRRLRPG
jgi:hypothetical protein